MATNGVLFAPKDYKELKDSYDRVAEGDNLTVALQRFLSCKQPPQLLEVHRLTEYRHA
jgi:hypothetical protein